MRDLRENIVVSVDDFGIRNVADAILPLAQQGKLDRVSVLINYMHSKDQAAELSATGVKIDLHLELIQLVKSGEKVQEGALLRGGNFLVRYISGNVRSSDVERMWIDQIECFKELFGRYPDGFNSHEHLHYFPKFFRIALSLGERYDVAFIRFSRKGVLRRGNAVISYVLAFLWKKDNRHYTSQKAPMDTTDFFISYDWIDNLDDFLVQLPNGKMEMVFHPERRHEYDVIEKYF
jgi:predicted glycoside hydrolase/deacetylase ChbG (UPF0249 family)